MKKTLVIGIAGGSASGKSTLAAKLAEIFEGLVKTKVINMDGYFKAPEERRMAAAPVTGKSYRDDNHPTSFSLDKLHADLTACIESGEYELVILEGLLVLWDEEILNKLDLKLFVDCRPDERIVRRLRRNMTWGLTFDEISNVYLDMVRYRHDEYVEPTKWRADMIVNGSNPSEKTLQLIRLWVMENKG